MLIHEPHVANRLARQARRREVRALKAHFSRVLGVLESRDTSTLSELQREARSRNIAELGRYASRGRFPKNEDRLVPRAPAFVDPYGTRCAMAHLIESSGGGALVERVVATKNNAFVSELARDPALVTWLDGSGLTKDEAALIQPSYCSTYAQECFCHMGVASAVFEGVVVSAEGATIALRITAVHGTSTVQVDDEVPAMIEMFTPAVGDLLLAAAGFSVVYRMDENGVVDTTTCQTFMFGEPPATAPKEAVIQNLLGMCGEGLDDPWMQQIGDCGTPAGSTASMSSSTSASTTGSGPSTSSGGDPGGEGGEGGAAADGGDDDGCSASPGDSSFGGAMLVASIVIGGALRLRTRREKKPRR
ncbi:MAG: hypothetical protein HOV80_06995 [Polyangiaceae bacterium]|nr:hypothetical protein [Polyangiaceae bacterium]